MSRLFWLLKNGLNDANPIFGPHKTLYNRFKRWLENGVFECIFKELAKPQNDVENILMIDTTHLRAHRTASSLKRGGDKPTPVPSETS